MRRIVIALCAVCVLAGTARAQTAAELFAEGLQLLDQGKPAEACAKLERALELEPNKPGVLLNLGVCNEKQNRSATALAWFRRALSLAAERGMTEVESVAKQQIKALSRKVPTVKIVMNGAENASVSVDGTQISSTSFARVEIDAGTRVFEVRTPGRETVRTNVVVDDVADTRQLVTLEVGPPVATVKQAKTATVIVDRGASRRHVGWILGGTGAGLMLGSAGLGLLARMKFDSTHNLETRKSWKDAALYGGTSMFVAGAAALAAGIGLYVTAPGKERVLEATVVPVVGEGGAGFALGGSF